jgi:sugar (pentulose or hexulose) kinase
VEGVAQSILANALNTSVCVSETAGEGGAWGMALLAAYMNENEGRSIGDWLEERVFVNAKTLKADPDKKGISDFNRYMELYNSGLDAQRALSEVK